MTAVCAISDGTYVYMGADSFCGSEHDCVPSRVPKVARVGPYLIGVAGEWRAIQTIHYRLKAPKPPKGRTLHRFMATEFADAVRAATRLGCAMEGLGESLILVGVGGRLFTIQSDGSVLESTLEYATIGTGSPVMDGSLHSTAGGDPNERIRMALKAAATHTPSVSPPFRVMCGQ